ncbi:MAG: GGDEF domain-containing phosphodiesterase, partial [Pseudomonadota bacterium]
TNLSSLEDVASTASSIQYAISEPLHGAYGQIGLRASVGVSVTPTHSREPDALLRMAGVALEAAKQAGRGNFQIYAPAMDSHSRERRELEDDLSRAISAGELELYYQPQIDLHSGQICGAEALVRWNHPQRGLVSPGLFVPIAEANGSIVEIGHWALWSAVEQRLAWHNDGLSGFRVAVNVSPRQVQSAGFVESVAAVLEASGLDPRLLELEVTENLVINHSDGVPDVLHDLYCLGIELAIDDFGTGYSSLNYLKRFSVHRLKIDRSFIADAQHEPEDRAIVRTVIRLGQTLGLRVLAEGVENKETIEFLKREGCDEVQGFYYAKPMPAQQFEQWVKEFTALNPAPDALPAPPDRSVA